MSTLHPVTNTVESARKANYFKLGLVILVIGCAVSFYRIVFLSEDMIYMIQALILAFMVLTILFQIIYWKIDVDKHHFTTPVLLVFLGVLFSMIMAYSSHNQGFGVSLWAQRFMYFYFFYFFLHILKVPHRQLEKIIFAFGVAYAAAFLIQYIIYPTVLFDVRLDPSRGTVRIFLPGYSFMLLAIFMSLEKIFYTNSLKSGAFMLLFLTVIFLSGTRQSIANIAFISLMALLFSKKIKSKYLIYFIAFMAAIAVYFLFKDIIMNLITLSQEQTQNTGGIKRLQTIRFFMTEFFPNDLAYVTGNGEAHQWSPFGVRVQNYKIRYGFYQSDIGFIGEYTKYGAFFALGVILLLIKALRQRLPQHMLYIKLFLFSSLITMPFGGIFSQPYSIVTFCLLLYLIDKHKAKTESKAVKKRPVVYFSELEKSSSRIMV